MFWRRAKFRLAEKYVMEFNDCARRQAADLGLSHEHTQLFLQRLLKDNVAQVPPTDPPTHPPIHLPAGWREERRTGSFLMSVCLSVCVPLP